MKIFPGTIKDDTAMKKTAIIIATAFIACVGCNKEIDTPVSEGITITAVAPPVNKTAVDGLQVQWTTGDKVALFQTGGSPELFTLQGEGPVTTGTFTSSATSLSPNGLAAYPGTSAANSGKQIDVEIPAEFAYGTAPIPMVGVSTGGTTFNFSLTTGAIRVSYTGVPEDASKFILTSDKNVSGTLRIADYTAPTGAAFTGDGTGKTFTVTGVTSGNLEFTLPLVAGTHNIEIKLVASDGTTVIPGSAKSISSLEVVAGKISKMKAIAVSSTPSGPQIYKISKLWIWGGTGPEYNCSKLYELLTDEQFAKYKNFDNTDNRGPRALKDNYFQLDPDSTFTNWAGADARNWWYVYSQNGQLLDLSSFYELIPRSTATWAMDGDNLTLTPSGGSAVTAKILPPGTYDLPNTSPLKQLTVSSMTLQFTITGGTDYWDNAASDLDVFAKHPRAMFLELEQMPEGFDVPEASKTTDADFEFEPPFDITSLPGAWNVYGGNKAPFGIWVLGGSGSDPAFVSPIEKSWDWSDSIWYESDNGLTISVSSMTETAVTGTTNWWSGNDGKWWDYTWKKTGEDLSRFYNKIPKGQSNFTLDIAKMEVTLGNGNVAKILKPGTYVYSQSYKNPTFTVPAACFALQFHIMDPISATSDQWSDVDRFVNAPLEYIIMFEKP